MVAEPVNATIQTLSYFYDSSRTFVLNQKDALTNSEYTERLLQLNPFQTTQEPILVQNDQQYNSLVDRIFHHLTKKRIVLYSGILTIGIGISVFRIFNSNVSNGTRLGGKVRGVRGGNSSTITSNRTASSNSKRRRVNKLANGARRDVILVVGSPTEPLTRLIALDFEKRGFIVYLTILDEKDLKYVELNPITDDINYLNLNDSFSFDHQLLKFKDFLEIPVVPFPNAKPHNLRFVSCVFSPSLYFPMGPIENITVASWLKLLERLQVVFKLLSSGLISIVREHQPYCKVLVLTSNIISSLNLPYHSPETFYQKSVQNLFAALTREVAQHKISITQIKLGNLNINSNNNSLKRFGASSSTSAPADPKVSASQNLALSEIRSWNDDIKELYSKDFTKSHLKSSRTLKSSSNVKSTNLRDLYHVLFDLIYPNDIYKMNPPVVYCGGGARIYDWLAGILPDSMITWLLM